MPIIFTEGSEPDSPEETFDSELQHVKLLFQQVEADGAYINVLKVPVETLVAKIDSRVSEISSAKSNIESIISTLEGYLEIPLDEFGNQQTDPVTGELIIDNLPECWKDANYGASDISSIISALNSIVSNCDTAINTILSELKTELNTPDIDNFKLHMDLLSGIDQAPPPGIIKPNNPALIALVRAVTDMEHRFGIAFTNYLVLVFETLFLGDLTIANAQADLDAEPFVGSLPAVISRVNDCPPEANAPTAIVADINAYGANFASWNSDVATHKPIFEQHIADDMAEYDALQDKLDKYIQAYNISAYISDPYYAFMYTDVFGAESVINIINQLQSGEIT